jgi:hypothetical protein
MINEHVVDRDTEAGEDAHGRVVEVRMFPDYVITSRKDIYYRGKLRSGPDKVSLTDMSPS